jgi:sterol desaturase/sphingolipid hydroxylase (fatty acid hydroxylase superfamily)
MLDQIVQMLGGDNGIWYLAAGYFSMVIGERVFHLVKGSTSYNDKDALCSIGLNLMNSIIAMVVSVFLPLVAYVWVYENARWFTIEHLALGLIIAFIVHELAYYCEHRLAHRVGLLWAFHAIHHSSNEFNHTTAARGFYFDGIMRTPFELVGAFLGVPPIVYFAMGAVKNLYGIWNHASYVGNLGPLEEVLATPHNHKVHHANQPQYIDKNFSQVLIIWDRLFGTFARYEEPPVVGLVSVVHDNNPLTAQFAGLKQLWARMKRAGRWTTRLAYLWRPPEWTHDGVCLSECPKYAPRQVSVGI